MNRLKIIHHAGFWVVLGLVALDGLFFGLTNPQQAASPLLIIGYVLAVGNWYVLLRLGSRFADLYSEAAGRRMRRLTKVLTGVVAVLLAMQSMGQLTLRDVTALGLLAVIGYFYLGYGRAPEPSL